MTFWSGILSFMGSRREDDNPAPTSSLNRTEAAKLGFQWENSLPKGCRSWCDVAPTGSMVPAFDSRSILLLELPTGPSFAKGQIVLRKVPNAPSICHRVVEVKDGSLYLSGDNNRNSDGWFPMSLIEWRVAAILYCSQ